MTICCLNCPVVDVGSARDDLVFLPKQACSPEEIFLRPSPQLSQGLNQCGSGQYASHWKNKKPLTVALRNEEEINSTRNETDLLTKCFLLPTYSMSILFTCFFQIPN